MNPGSWSMAVSENLHPPLFGLYSSIRSMFISLKGLLAEKKLEMHILCSFEIRCIAFNTGTHMVVYTACQFFSSNSISLSF